MGAPKPPSNRITLTLPLLNRARHIGWVVTGSGKADIVARILNASPGSQELPAGQVKPSIGDSRWFIDQDAAAGL
jgi:6-phosphogluconolactonase